MLDKNGELLWFRYNMKSASIINLFVEEIYFFNNETGLNIKIRT